MDNAKMFESFRFGKFCFLHSHFTDATAGVQMNYLGFMRSGTAKIVSEDKTIELCAGDLFYIPMGLKYRSYWKSEGVVSWDSFGFTFFPDEQKRLYMMQKISYNHEQLSIIEKISGIQRKSCYQIGLFYILLGKILPNLKEEQIQTDNQIIRLAADYFFEHDKCTVPEAAKHCNISVSELYLLFRKNGLGTPNSLRQKLLADKATQLLTNTDIAIEEISSRLGFSSSSYFRKIIFKQTGKTPRQIRSSSIL